MIHRNVRQELVADEVHIDEHDKSQGNADFADFKEAKRIAQLFDLVSNQNIDGGITNQSQTATGHGTQESSHQKLGMAKLGGCADTHDDGNKHGDCAGVAQASRHNTCKNQNGHNHLAFGLGIAADGGGNHVADARFKQSTTDNNDADKHNNGRAGET